MERPCLRTLWSVAVMLFLTACMAEESPSSHGEQASETKPSFPPVRPGHTFVYDCNDGSRITVRIESDKAWLFLQSGTISLPHVKAASGAKYSDGATVYWTKGESAVMERPGHPRLECINNRAKAIWEDAKLRGADFRATGNEPGWYLEISSAYGIVFVTNYGADRLHFQRFETSSDHQSRKTVYRARNGAHGLTVSLEGRQCSDSMSGEQFETTVSVTLDETKFNGCGRALH